jgi:hypothetical protein
VRRSISGRAGRPWAEMRSGGADLRAKFNLSVVGCWSGQEGRPTDGGGGASLGGGVCAHRGGRGGAHQAREEWRPEAMGQLVVAGRHGS